MRRQCRFRVMHCRWIPARRKAPSVANRAGRPGQSECLAGPVSPAAGICRPRGNVWPAGRGNSRRFRLLLVLALAGRRALCFATAVFALGPDRSQGGNEQGENEQQRSHGVSVRQARVRRQMRFPGPAFRSTAQTVKGVIGPLAFGLEHDLQETSEVARRPSLEFEPAKILGRQRMECASPVAAEGHGPGAQLLPIGRGLVRIHASP
jgi:hypothetical protein